MLTANQDVARQQGDSFTFVGHEMGEEAIFVELLSGSDAEKFNEYLKAKQLRDGNLDPPLASAPPLTESEVEPRYAVCTVQSGKKLNCKLRGPFSSTPLVR